MKIILTLVLIYIVYLIIFVVRNKDEFKDPFDTFMEDEDYERRD